MGAATIQRTAFKEILGIAYGSFTNAIAGGRQQCAASNPAIVAGQTGGTSMERARHSIYALIHKALRLAMCETLAAVGRLDASDAREVSDAIARARDLLRFCRMHLHAEETFIHPAIEARRPGVSGRIAGEHVEHLASLASLERAVDAVARAPAAGRAAAAFALYAELGRFVGENFVHMHHEETAHNRALWDAYTDEEILAVENAIKAHHTPEEMAFVLRWMLPAMTPAERAGLLAAMRKVAPPPVVENVVALARAHVDPAGFDKLALALAA